MSGSDQRLATTACGVLERWWCSLHGGAKDACKHVTTPMSKSV